MVGSSTRKKVRTGGLPAEWGQQLTTQEQMLKVFEAAGVRYTEEKGVPRSIDVLTHLFVDGMSVAAVSRLHNLPYPSLRELKNNIMTRLRPVMRGDQTKWEDVTVRVPAHLVAKIKSLEGAAVRRRNQVNASLRKG